MDAADIWPEKVRSKVKLNLRTEWLVTSENGMHFGKLLFESEKKSVFKKSTLMGRHIANQRATEHIIGHFGDCLLYTSDAADE